MLFICESFHSGFVLGTRRIWLVYSQQNVISFYFCLLSFICCALIRADSEMQIGMATLKLTPEVMPCTLEKGKSIKTVAKSYILLLASHSSLICIYTLLLWYYDNAMMVSLLTVSPTIVLSSPSVLHIVMINTSINSINVSFVNNAGVIVRINIISTASIW